MGVLVSLAMWGCPADRPQSRAAAVGPGRHGSSAGTRPPGPSVNRRPLVLLPGRRPPHAAGTRGLTPTRQLRALPAGPALGAGPVPGSKRSVHPRGARGRADPPPRTAQGPILNSCHTCPVFQAGLSAHRASHSGSPRWPEPLAFVFLSNLIRAASPVSFSPTHGHFCLI